MKERVGHDIDYAATTLTFKDVGKDAAIVHGSGANWSSGLPADRDVWVAETFQESVFDSKPTWIIDSRGVTRSGRHWRQVGSFGETAYYRDVDQQTASLLDSVIDKACLRFGEVR